MVTSYVKNKLVRVAQQVPIVRRLLRRHRWGTELELLNGGDPSTSSHTSIIHFTINRAASQWVKSVLRRFAVAEDMVHVRWNEFAFNSEYPYLDDLQNVECYEHVFRKQGYLYSAFGGYVEGIPNIEEYKVVLFVRDPRDVLTSRYFSKKSKRGLPPRSGTDRKEFIRERKFAKSVSIDRFVLDKCEELRGRYEAYLDELLEEHGDVHVSRYEDMTADVEGWLGNLLEYVELPPRRDLCREVIEEAGAISEKDENEFQHYRKGRPGDYREKLEETTVRELTLYFEKILEAFGYTG